ncbi:MAG: hypothetical protein N3G22_01725 [Candidatus Micrarchaeota archaeon]|nr:hypothetical protein [Candidatus Micrarchaeota archaeon]
MAIRQGTIKVDLSTGGHFQRQEGASAIYRRALSYFQAEGTLHFASIPLKPMQLAKEGTYEFSLLNAICEIKNGIFVLEDQSRFRLGADLSGILKVLLPHFYSDSKPLLRKDDFVIEEAKGNIFYGTYRIFETGAIAVFIREQGKIEVQAAIPKDSSLVLSYYYSTDSSFEAADRQVVCLTPTFILRLSEADGPSVVEVPQRVAPLLRPEITQAKGYEKMFEVCDGPAGHRTNSINGLHLSSANRKFLIDFNSNPPLVEPIR